MNKYKPISKYAAIGNMHSIALISTDGSIDWCCLPYFHSPSVYASILDSEKGGFFKIILKGCTEGYQEYIIDSNVLQTTYQDENRKIIVTDFMPVFNNLEEFKTIKIEPEIERLIECHGEECEVEITWIPRLNYASGDTRISFTGEGWIAKHLIGSLSLCGLNKSEINEETDSSLKATIKLKRGDKRVIISRWDCESMNYDVEESGKKKDATVDAWQKWSHVLNGDNHDWAGEWLPYILRSELVLKMLDYAKTGALVAAPTTSLPETIGGVRNWDYRFVWLRDAALAGNALIALGHNYEADNFLIWIEELAVDEFENHLSLQIMYTLDGGADIDEVELEYFEGYKKSYPVRIGNGAAKQFQLETFGEVMLIAYELLRRGRKLSDKIMDLLVDLAEFVSKVWMEKDAGIWEIRGEAQHFIYSKIMAWTTLDRAVYFSKHFGLNGDAEKWERERNKIKDYILQHGYNEKVKSFIQYPGCEYTDASLLRIPMVEFLPADDYRVQNTVQYIIDTLVENKMVYRYKNDDGLPGEEGAFSLCTFWLVDVLALSGRIEEAKDIFNNMIKHANHAGLFSEQIDTKTGEHLGNFPQAFTHIGLINSALYLAYAEGKKIPVENLAGTKEHRELFGRVEKI
jgi:GH15 family glucan-1,4-alpha-glucosidase